MALDSKPLEGVNEADLQELIMDSVAEQQGIDYKKAVHLGADPPKDELRRDVTSFANAVGGHLIIGMDEQNGFPTDLCGVEIDSPDAFKLRVSEVLQSKIHPRVPGIGIHIVPLANGRHAVVIRVPRSFARPHQITVGKDSFEFWARNAAGKYRLSVDELRSVILQSESVAERVRQFRMERVAAVVAGDTPILMRPERAKIVLHLVPLTAFDPTAPRCDISCLHLAAFRMLTATMMQSGGSAVGGTYNVDGYVSSLTKYMRAPSESYVQVFRNGIVEAADAELLDYTPPLWQDSTEEMVLNQVERGLRLQQAMGVPASPVAVLLSLVGVSECVVVGPRVQPMDGSTPPTHPFGRDVVLAPDVVVDPLVGDLYTAVRPVLDAVWNAGGFPACLNYDEQGMRKQ